MVIPFFCDNASKESDAPLKVEGNSPPVDTYVISEKIALLQRGASVISTEVSFVFTYR